MPIIFASSLLMFPSFILNSLAARHAGLADASTWTVGVGVALVLPGGGRRLPEAGLRLHRLSTSS